MLNVMAQAANGRTGVGRAGQTTIAAMMGITDRAVRKLLCELDQAVQNGTSPVRVVRRPRFLPEGRGRTSDEYVIELTNRNSGSPCSTPPTGTAVPVTHDDQPERKPRLTGTGKATNRNSGSGDQHDQHDQRSTSAPRSRKREKPPKPPKPPPVVGAHDLKLHYVAEYQRLKGATAELGPKWPRAMKAFGELVTTHGLERSKGIVTRALADNFARRIMPWELADDALKWLGQQPRGNGVAVQRGMDASVKFGTPDYLEDAP